MTRQDMIDKAWREGFHKYATDHGITDPVYVEQLITAHGRIKLAKAYPEMFNSGFKKVAQDFGVGTAFSNLFSGLGNAVQGGWQNFAGGLQLKNLQQQKDIEENRKMYAYEQNRLQGSKGYELPYDQYHQQQLARNGGLTDIYNPYSNDRAGGMGGGMGGDPYAGYNSGPSYWNQGGMGGGVPSMYGMGGKPMRPEQFKLHMASTEAQLQQLQQAQLQQLQQAQQMRDMHSKYFPTAMSGGGGYGGGYYNPYRSLAYAAGGYRA